MIKKAVKAFLDTDLENVLLKLEELHDIRAGKRKCKICQNMITIDNISCIIPESGSIKYTCKNDFCISSVTHKSKDVLHG